MDIPTSTMGSDPSHLHPFPPPVMTKPNQPVRYTPVISMEVDDDDEHPPQHLHNRGRRHPAASLQSSPSPTALSLLTNDNNHHEETSSNHSHMGPTPTTTPINPTDRFGVTMSFWILGLLNNASYVIMIASAKSISEGGTALVFLANIVPSLTIKLTAPYWFDQTTYQQRLQAATFCMMASFLLVAAATGTTSSTNDNDDEDSNNHPPPRKSRLILQLLGVALGSTQGGLGEASLLALAGRFDGYFASILTCKTTTTTTTMSQMDSTDDAAFHNTSITSRSHDDEGTAIDDDNVQNNNNININKKLESYCLTSFSSGTGMAGVFGFFWKWFWNDWWGLSLSQTLYLALSLALAYWKTFQYTLLRLQDEPQHVSVPPSLSTTHMVVVQDDTWNDEIGCGVTPTDNDDDDNIVSETPSWSVSGSSTSLRHHKTRRQKPKPQLHGPDQGLDHPPLEIQALTLSPCGGDRPNPPDFVVAPQSCSPARDIANQSSARERFHAVLGLWPYMIPLFVVYAAEYALQSGTWTAIGFPLDSREARDRFYEYSNWMYQAGVLISRSSGTLVTLPLSMLWLMPTLQVVNLMGYTYVAATTAAATTTNTTTGWYRPGVLYGGAFYTGLLGGAVYIHGYKRICLDVPYTRREFSLSSASVAEGLGVLVADGLGLVIQSCLYQVNGLDGALVQCPLQPHRRAR